MLLKNRHTAFTMIELIFVIVIMGIIGKFGTEFVARAYESFIYSKINHDLQAKSASAVEFIAKRLEHRIKASTIARNPSQAAPNYNYVEDTGLPDANATVFEWIATDIDGFRGTTTPLWSAVIDLNATNANRLISTATALNATNAQISILSSGSADINDSAIYFIGSFKTANPYGYDGAIADQNQSLHPIQSGANTNEIWPKGLAPDFSGKEVFEYYKLAWTAYAVSLEDYNHTTNIGNLYLYYNYRPWNGENYNDNTTPRVLLAEGINTFRYRSAGSLIKIQVCAKSKLTGEEHALCKEKTVY